jgi:hypothetical protein
MVFLAALPFFVGKAMIIIAAVALSSVTAIGIVAVSATMSVQVVTTSTT